MSKHLRRDSATFPIKHAVEFEAPDRALPYVPLASEVHALYISEKEKKSVNSKRPSVFSRAKSYSSIAKSYMPPLLRIAWGEVSKAFGVTIGIRRTGATFDHLPNAPKDTNVKLKTGKSSVSFGVVPKNLKTRSTLDDKGLVIPLSQSKTPVPDTEEPKDDNYYCDAHYPIPLEQVVIGLRASPPQGTPQNVLIQEPGESLEDTYARIKRTGILQFKTNTLDEELGSFVYELKLDDSVNLVAPLPFAINSKRVSPAVEGVDGEEFPIPLWWNAEWGSYNEKVQYGYPLMYKCKLSHGFEPYMVEAMMGIDAKPIPSPGDPDVWMMSKSTEYDFGDLENDRIDTNDEGGAERLAQGLIKVHNVVLVQDLLSATDRYIDAVKAIVNQEMSSVAAIKLLTKKYEDELLEIKEVKAKELKVFTKEFERYIESWGAGTAVHAYMIIRMNLREAELKEESALSEKHAQDILMRESDYLIEDATGLDYIIKKRLNVDLPAVYFEEKHGVLDQAIDHVDYQLAQKRFVPEATMLAYRRVLEQRASARLNQKSSKLFYNKINSVKR